MTDRECEDLGKRIALLVEQLGGFVWPEYAFDTLEDVQNDLLNIAAKLCGE